MKVFKKLSNKKMMNKYFSTAKNRHDFADWMVHTIHTKTKSFPRLITTPIIDDKFGNYIPRKENIQFKCEEISYEKITDIIDQTILKTIAFENNLFFSKMNIKPEIIEVTDKFLNDLFIKFKYEKIICSYGAYQYTRKILGSKKMINRVNKDNLFINRSDTKNRIFLFLKDFAVLFVGLVIEIKMIENDSNNYINIEIENKFNIHLGHEDYKIIEIPAIDT